MELSSGAGAPAPLATKDSKAEGKERAEAVTTGVKEKKGEGAIAATTPGKKRAEAVSTPGKEKKGDKEDGAAPTSSKDKKGGAEHKGEAHAPATPTKGKITGASAAASEGKTPKKGGKNN